ncbi:MAG: FG-GAP-like repeat-containing protein [Phycisphaerales bacterium]
MTMIRSFAWTFSLAVVTLTAGTDAGVVFTDVTAQAGIDMIHAPKPSGVPAFNEWMMGGTCILDANRDGWPDIFVLKGGLGSDRLYINKGDGTFTDMAAPYGLAATHCGIGASTGDFNGDGWPDIYVTSYGNGSNNQGEIGKNRLYRNNGNGTFAEVAVAAGVNVTSAIASAGDGSAWGDYDLDGDLDLAVAAWSPTAAGNRLFRNNGDGTFTDVTGTAIVIPTATWGFQPSFADMDGDGFPDLLYSADFGSTRAFRNNGDGTFTQATQQWGVGVVGYGMGQCVADLNRDGLLDWYVTSIYLDRPSNPNVLNGNAHFLNTGTGSFRQAAAPSGTADGGWGWGVVAGDFDQDGWLDLVEVNGRDAGEFQLESEYFYHNNGDGTFFRDPAVSSTFLAAEGRTVVTFDYDHDGDLDLLIYYNAGPLKLYRNDSTNVGSWLEVSFSAGTNPYVASFGYGVRAVATVGSTQFTRYLDGGNSYLGSSELMLHFGLGNAAIIDQLTITWPRGRTTTLTNVPVNQRLSITAPSLADLDGDGVVGATDLGMMLGAWGPVSANSRHIDLDNDGSIGASDLGILLGAWTN